MGGQNWQFLQANVDGRAVLLGFRFCLGVILVSATCLPVITLGLFSDPTPNAGWHSSWPKRVSRALPQDHGSFQNVGRKGCQLLKA